MSQVRPLHVLERGAAVMSPWGRFYLEHFTYSPGWWEPCESWRMCWMIDHASTAWGPIGSGLWRRVETHLDCLSICLRSSVTCGD